VVSRRARGAVMSFLFSSRRRHTRFSRDWSSDVCSSDLIMASEGGVGPIAPENVKAKGRLEPGKMFLIDFEQGRLVPDEELKNDFANRRPYGECPERERISLRDVGAEGGERRSAPETLVPRLRAVGHPA